MKIIKNTMYPLLESLVGKQTCKFCKSQFRLEDIQDVVDHTTFMDDEDYDGGKYLNTWMSCPICKSDWVAIRTNVLDKANASN